jgi:hypothetical protein
LSNREKKLIIMPSTLLFHIVQKLYRNRSCIFFQYLLPHSLFYTLNYMLLLQLPLGVTWYNSYQFSLTPDTGLSDTQRQPHELISGPNLGAKAKLLSFNRTQSRVVTGLLTGHNTLRRHLHLLGLQDSPLRRRCGAKEETSAHILCECEALASLRQVHLGSFFLEPEDIKSINLGAIWNFGKATGLPWFDMGHKGPVN